MKLRIAVLEDNRLDVELIQTTLEADGLQFTLVHVDEVTGLHKVLHEAPCDVVLIDYWLPRGDGLSALRLCAERYPDTPVIVVSGMLGEEQAIDTLKLGATDFVLKHNIARLPVAVRRALRERSEREARRRAEELRERFFALSADLFSVHDDAGNFLDANSGWERVLGWTRADLIGHSYSEFLHPDDVEPSRVAHMRVLAGKELGLFENRYRTRDGGLRWLQWSASIDAGSGLAYAVARDVTALKALNANLQLQAAQQAAIASFGSRALRSQPLPSLFDDAAEVVARTLDVELVGIVERTQDGNHLRLVGRFGWPANVIDKHGFEISARYHGGFTVLHNTPVRIDDWDTETRFDMAPPLRDMQVKSGVCVPIPGHGKPYGAIGVQTRTKRHFSDDDVNFLTAIAHVLAESVERQHAELELARSQEHLRQAQKLEAVGQLASGVAHDFNNVLTAILGYAELAEGEVPAGSDAQSFLKEIRRASQRANDLTRSLLAFSRKQVLAPRVLDLNREIQEVRSLLERAIGEDIDLRFDLAPDLGPVELDASQVGQVLLNLVVNARDAMPLGGRVDVETRNVATLDDAPAQEGGWVLLAVRDRGAGIAPDVLPRIFEPFFTTKPRGRGTGMGLATVLGIVEQSRGTLRVESSLGEGSAFRLYFPRSHEPLAALPKLSRRDARRGRAADILVVEDDAAIRELMRRVLAGAGHEVSVAEDGQRALDMAKSSSQPFDLVISDLVLPQLNGAALREALVPLKKAKHWLFVSGFGSHPLVERRLREANVAVLAKPFSADDLLARVEDALAQVGA